MLPRSALIRNQKGFALLLSLLIIFLLVVIIFEADFQIRADLRAAGNFRDDLKALYLSRSGISAGEALLKDDVVNSNIYDGLDEFWAFPIPEYPLGDGLLSGSIIDEERKININYLVNKTSTGTKINEARKTQLERLFELLEVNPELVDPMIDWIDADEEALPFGAEDETYERRDPGYSASNKQMNILSELHMVHGITDEIYKKITPYLTVYGNGKINVNTADRIVLQSFDEEIDETEARRLIDKRPFKKGNATDFRDLLSDEVRNRIASGVSVAWMTTRSSYFSLTAEGQVNDTRKISSAVVKRTGRVTKLLYFRVE